MKLTNAAIKQAKATEKDYKLSDGKGLYLLVKKNSSKYWRLKYRLAGKEKTLSLGVYPEVSLADARKATDKARDLISQGLDPSAEKKRQKREAITKTDNAFEVLAREWWDQQRGRWADSHAKRVLGSLERDIFPVIGHIPVTDVTPPDVLAALKLVERRGALDVAGRLLQRTSAVFRYAIQTGRASVNPASELSGVLKTRKVEHRASLPQSELPAFLEKLDHYDGNLTTQLALKILVLTFVRPGELRGGRWEEFEIENRLWRIPGERMKMKTEHIVPLSDQVLALLEVLKPITGHYDLLFPGERDRAKPISENTMIYAMYRMGYHGRATPHGFRATASSILNEQGFNPDAIERQLSHLERNKIRGAYTHHAEYLPDRREIMDWWSLFIETKCQPKVVPITRARKSVAG